MLQQEHRHAAAHLYATANTLLDIACARTKVDEEENPPLQLAEKEAAPASHQAMAARPGPKLPRWYDVDDGSAAKHDHHHADQGTVIRAMQRYAREGQRPWYAVKQCVYHEGTP